MLVILHCEGTNVGECLKKLEESAMEKLPHRGKIKGSKIRIGMGAFMSVSVILTIDPAEPYKPGVITAYAVAGSKETALEELQAKLNERIRPDMVLEDFDVEVYTTPVTRRTYAVGVVTYNRPAKGEFEDMKLVDRRKLLAKLLELLNYNPKALNISELARMFGVSRDSIYNDIQQILGERRAKS
ncbi:HTH domain-containing protein [Pyrococcus yayanosii]|uniref:Helix-turn-helix type 11 domain-containing protein n=1 Tax=Pyrococcus yayanosii (strain CH1 / JCM 16557) TaxID=529709 RepID=F8AHQ5_PYRYC|nr:HTH domain-containing protein [Pyrococcus yayanosii]AEH24188.1 hypothetical protein PYCH_04980 [Pyrococcus yayanosii CH1]